MIHLFHDWSRWTLSRVISHYEYQGASYPYKTSEVWFRECEFCGKPKYKRVSKS